MSSFKNIETAFGNLKNNPSAKNLQELGGALTSEFKKSIRCEIVASGISIGKLVMSVYPDVSTIDKIISYAANDTSKVETIISIWQGANFWTMEINEAVLKKLTPSELTALSCHEVWHIIYSDRAINRLRDSLHFMFSTASKMRKGIITMPKFMSILRIPGLIACRMTPNKTVLGTEALAHKKYLDKEMSADIFSAKNGYRTALISAIDKITAEISKDKNSADEVASSISFTTGIIDDLGHRRNELAKDKLNSIQKMFPGTAIGEEAHEISDSWFASNDIFLEEESIVEAVNDQIFMELAVFTKRLPPIENNQIDYIGVKCNNIETINDQIMVVSYVNSKIEVIDYYIGILNNKSLSKKYVVPHTLGDLEQFRSRLESIRERALNMRTVKDNRSVVVYYPDQYKG